jgi:hypothetical protein
MTEADRLIRNRIRLLECHPTFRERVERILQGLQRRGFRPRIQAAARSPEDQLEAWRRGTSKLKFGFHNITGPHGQPQSLAVDILDDDAPLAPDKPFLVGLAVEAKKVGCQTGIAWGLPSHLRTLLELVISKDATMVGDYGDLKIGWDPTHVEPLNLTVARAKLGERPPLLEES